MIVWQNFIIQDKKYFVLNVFAPNVKSEDDDDVPKDAKRGQKGENILVLFLYYQIL